MTRRDFIFTTAAAPLAAATDRRARNWMDVRWTIDPRCVLPRGGPGTFDRGVVGDPCIVWDEDISNWRMFYFASPGTDKNGVPEGRIAGMAVSKSPEDIAPGDWRKLGPAEVSNPKDMTPPKNGHKFWVVMDPKNVNHAVRIDGRYWGLFVVGAPKHIYAASAERLGGPWTVVPEPVISPGAAPGAPDGKQPDTPTAYWFEDRREVVIFYKAYPAQPQAGQPGSSFGSSTVVAYWHPSRPTARKANQILVPGREPLWNRGWIGGFQLLFDPKKASWYALLNASPTPPEDRSNREPAPSLGGWAVCRDRNPAGIWEVDRKRSPFARPDRLSSAELDAGLGVNFWRHHLLVTPSGQARIFFNSGKYGTEQMYSLSPATAK